MNNLPEDCIAKILSLTTPRDVSRLSAVSRIFRSAAESDDVWNQFLPTNFPASFAAPAGLSTRKQLFFYLVHNPLLLNDAQLEAMNNLPEDCIAKILSLTTPRDVSRLSAVSRIFRSAAESDDVWNQFLPANFPAGFATPAGLATRKQLFFSLAHNPLLLNDAQLSFSLERECGKKCYMMAARSLSIIWGHDQRYWRWISLPNTRFPEVAELIMVWWLEITGKINIDLLSDDTLYAAYLVFKWNDSPYGFRQPVEASLVLAENPEDVQPSMVSLMQNPGNEEGKCAELRSDGWYEVELGNFFKRRGDMGEIEMSLKETKRPFEKKGLILHGIEIRPMP